MALHAHRALVLAAVLAGATTSYLSAQVVCYESNLGTLVGTGDDSVLPIQPIGFAFSFNGATYTDFHACTNGFIYLSNGGTPPAGGAMCCSGYTAGLVAAAGPMICPRWDDLVVNAPGGVFVNNTLPGKCVVTWLNAIEYGNSTAFTMQLQLYSSGLIQFYYDANTSVRTTGPALVGMSPGNGATVPTASDLSSPGSSSTATIFQLFDTGNPALAWDLSSLGVLFMPSGPSSYAFTQMTCGAVHVGYGSGCYNSAGSVYELFGTASGFDLSGQTMTMAPSGPGYLVTTAPVSTFFTPLGPSLGLTDDSLSAPIPLPSAFPWAGGSSTSITVCSNGRVFLGGGTNSTYSVSSAQFLTDGPSLGTYFDFNPTAGGTVVYDFDAPNNQAIVTWNGVYAFGTTSPNTWQIVLSLAGSAVPGQVEMRWQSFVNNSTSNGSAALVGFTVGNYANDPGTRDISGTVPFVTPGEAHPLTLSAAPAPALGTPVTWTVGNIPASAYFSAYVMNWAQVAPPGLDLGYLGAPGCPQLVALGGASSLLIFGTPTATQTITLPTGASWIGVTVFSQGASFVPGVNPLGLLTSNGLQTTMF